MLGGREPLHLDWPVFHRPAQYLAPGGKVEITEARFPDRRLTRRARLWEITKGER